MPIQRERPWFAGHRRLMAALCSAAALSATGGILLSWLYRAGRSYDDVLTSALQDPALADAAVPTPTAPW
jgi:hypothetical protein